MKLRSLPSFCHLFYHSCFPCILYSTTIHSRCIPLVRLSPPYVEIRPTSLLPMNASRLNLFQTCFCSPTRSYVILLSKGSSSWSVIFPSGYTTLVPYFRSPTPVSPHSYVNPGTPTFNVAKNIREYS